jgi:hypothetical protein
MLRAATPMATQKGAPHWRAKKPAKAPHTKMPPRPKCGTRRMLKMVVRLMAMRARTAPCTIPFTRTWSTARGYSARAP